MSETLRIHIAEDELALLSEVERYSREYTISHGLDCEILAFNDRFETLLDGISSDPGICNIYFLDILLGDGCNGLQLAQKIRSKDILGYIVFITSHMEFAFPAIQYKIRALDYILKSGGDIRARIFQCLDTVMRELEGAPDSPGEKTIVIRTNGTHFILPLDDILYFETNTSKRSIILYTRDKKIEFRDTLDELQERVGESFYRCHRSFLINLKHLESICRKRGDLHVVLSNGTKCMISPRYLRGLLRYERNFR